VARLVDRNKLSFLLPGLLFLCAVYAAPMVYSIGVTLVRWIMIRPDLGIRFVGLHNYSVVLRAVYTWLSVGRTLVFVVGAVGLELVLGVAIALFLNRNFFGARFLQSIMLIPFMMAPIVVGFAWRFLVNNETGPLPNLLSSVGLGAIVNPPLLANPRLALPVLAVVDVWQFTPFVMLVVLAGLKALPTEPFEAARADGATRYQTFFRVTLPLLKPAILVAVVIRTLTALRLFDTVFIMTGGGPGNSTEVLSFYVYRLAFETYDMGKAGTVGIIALLIAMLLTLLYIRTIGVEKQ